MGPEVRILINPTPLQLTFETGAHRSDRFEEGRARTRGGLEYGLVMVIVSS